MAPEEMEALEALYTKRFGLGRLCVYPGCIHWYSGRVPQGEIRRYRRRWLAAWWERHSMTYNHGDLCAESLGELVRLGAPTFKTPLAALLNDSR